MNTNRPVKGAPTALNVWTLGKVANGRRVFPNKLQPTQAAGMRRCLAAGLVEVFGSDLRLTDAGIAAVNADQSVPYVSTEE
jgi:hypothetical protein